MCWNHADTKPELRINQALLATCSSGFGTPDGTEAAIPALSSAAVTNSIKKGSAG